MERSLNECYARWALKIARCAYYKTRRCPDPRWEKWVERWMSGEWESKASAKRMAAYLWTCAGRGNADIAWACARSAVAAVIDQAHAKHHAIATARMCLEIGVNLSDLLVMSRQVDFENHGERVDRTAILPAGWDEFRSLPQGPATKRPRGGCDGRAK